LIGLAVGETDDVVQSAVAVVGYEASKFAMYAGGCARIVEDLVPTDTALAPASMNSIASRRCGYHPYR
jgi:hypothetical protein